MLGKCLFLLLISSILLLWVWERDAHKAVTILAYRIYCEYNGGKWTEHRQYYYCDNSRNKQFSWGIMK